MEPDFILGMVAGFGLGLAYAHAQRLVAAVWRTFVTRLHLGSDVWR